MISRAFKIAVKLAGRPAWKIAQEAGMCSGTLSRIVSGHVIARPTNTHGKNAVKIGAILGLKPDKSCRRNNDRNNFDRYQSQGRAKRL